LSEPVCCWPLSPTQVSETVVPGRTGYFDFEVPDVKDGDYIRLTPGSMVGQSGSFPTGPCIVLPGSSEDEFKNSPSESFKAPRGRTQKRVLSIQSMCSSTAIVIEKSNSWRNKHVSRVIWQLK
jgi:hypothetical protein